METDGSAEIVARSFAIGTFIALLPTVGLGFFFTLLLLVYFTSLHKPAALSAFVVWNPLVQVPLYALSAIIGGLIFSGMPVVSYDFAFLDHVVNFTRRVFIGNLIVTTTLTIISYLAVFIAIRRLKHKPVFRE